MLWHSPEKDLWNVNKFFPDLCIFIVWNFCHFASFCKILPEREDVYGPVLRGNFFECQACYSENLSFQIHCFPCNMLNIYLCYSCPILVLTLYTVFSLYRFICKFWAALGFCSIQKQTLGTTSYSYFFVLIPFTIFSPRSLVTVTYTCCTMVNWCQTVPLLQTALFTLFLDLLEVKEVRIYTNIIFFFK